MPTNMSKSSDSHSLPRILLLSGASLVGQNIMAALSSRRDQLVLYAANSRADEPTLFDFDGAFLTPSVATDPDAFDQRFDTILSKTKPDLVIPCRDDDVAFIAARADRVTSESHRYLCGASEIAAALLDKWESWRFSDLHGLPFAPTIRADSAPGELMAFVRAHSFPLIAKPIKGFASRGVVLILNQGQLDRLTGRKDCIVQAYLGDPDRVQSYAASVTNDGVPLFHTFEEVKHSIQGCISPEGKVSGLMVSRNLMRFGRSERVEIETAAEFLAEGTKWVTAFADAGWRGPVNIQCQRGRDGKLAIYEYNGRFTGATSARSLLGFDEVGMVMRDWLGYELRPVPAQSGTLTVIRSMTSRALDLDKVAKLTQLLEWRP